VKLRDAKAHMIGTLKEALLLQRDIPLLIEAKSSEEVTCVSMPYASS